MSRKPYFVRPDNRGFTLVEILVAMAVLAIVSIPLLSYFSDASKLNALSSKRHKANLTAQAVMEDFKNRRLEDIAEEFQGFPSGTTSGQYTDGTYSMKMLQTYPFVFTRNDKDDPYYFQLSNYNYCGSNYDVRIKVDEDIYKNNRTVTGGPIYYNNFLDFDIRDVEGNNNAVIVEGSNDSQSAANALYQFYLDNGNPASTTVYNMINANLKRVIKLSVNTESVNKVKVVCSFEYSCPVIPSIAGETKIFNRYNGTFDDLKAIYFFYRPLYNSMQNEEIKVDSDLPDAEKLSSIYDIYIWGRDSNLHDTYILYETSSPLKLMQDGNGNFGYVNASLKNNVTVQGLGYKVPPLGDTYRTVDATVYNKNTEREQRLFTIEVSVYNAGHAGESDNLLFTLNSAEDD